MSGQTTGDGDATDDGDDDAANAADDDDADEADADQGYLKFLPSE